MLDSRYKKLTVLVMLLSFCISAFAADFSEMEIRESYNRDRVMKWVLTENTLEDLDKGDIRAYIASPDIIEYLEGWKEDNPLTEDIYSIEYGRTCFVRTAIDKVSGKLKSQLDDDYEVHVYSHTDYKEFSSNSDYQKPFSYLSSKLGIEEEDVTRITLNLHYFADDGEFLMVPPLKAMKKDGSFITTDENISFSLAYPEGFLDSKSTYKEKR